MLVCGTVVYSRGDEEGVKQELSEAVTEALAAPLPAPVEEQAPLLAAAAAPPVGIAARAPSTEPVIVRGSFKSTMNIMSGSYSRSFTRGSLPRGSLGGNSFAIHPHAPSIDSEQA